MIPADTESWDTLLSPFSTFSAFPTSTPTLTLPGLQAPKEAHITLEMVRQVVREELQRQHGSHLVPVGAELRAEYFRLTGREMP